MAAAEEVVDAGGLQDRHVFVDINVLPAFRDVVIGPDLVNCPDLNRALPEMHTVSLTAPHTVPDQKGHHARLGDAVTVATLGHVIERANDISGVPVDRDAFTASPETVAWAKKSLLKPLLALI